MATANLLTLIDDIATVLDDVSVLTKVAAEKTAGVLGDDLALNAQQVTGVRAEREIPVVWAVAKGSFINKLILVPAALALSLFAPWLITPLLILGGLFLCFEGAEKVLHKLLHSKADDEADKQALHDALVNDIDLVEFEKNKISGAIRTDMILSAEIIVIALGTVTDQSFAMQSAVVSAIALLMTVGVYGLVAGIVKLDDAGLHLMHNSPDQSLAYRFGRGLLNFCPYLMKTLSVVGTIAMFLVGGGILSHGVEPIHHLTEHWTHALAQGNAVLEAVVSNSIILLLGLGAGAVLAIIFQAVQKLRGADAH